MKTGVRSLFACATGFVIGSVSPLGCASTASAPKVAEKTVIVSPPEPQQQKPAAIHPCEEERKYPYARIALKIAWREWKKTYTMGGSCILDYDGRAFGVTLKPKDGGPDRVGQGVCDEKGKCWVDVVATKAAEQSADTPKSNPKRHKKKTPGKHKKSGIALTNRR